MTDGLCLNYHEVLPLDLGEPPLNEKYSIVPWRFLDFIHNKVGKENMRLCFVVFALRIRILSIVS
jgi:hypothetical protein